MKTNNPTVRNHDICNSSLTCLGRVTNNGHLEFFILEAQPRQAGSKTSYFTIKPQDLTTLRAFRAWCLHTGEILWCGANHELQELTADFLNAPKIDLSAVVAAIAPITASPLSEALPPALPSCSAQHP